MPELESKTIEIDNGGETLTVQLTKLDCLAASDWLMRLGVTISKAGIRYSGGKQKKANMETANAEEAITEMLEKEESGGEVFFQLPSLQIEDIQTLLTRMMLTCEIVREDPVSHKTVPIKMTEQNIRANIKTLECLWRVRWEAIKYNFGFFEKGGSSLLKRLKASLNPLSTETSLPSSES